MKDPADKVTTEMFSTEEKLNQKSVHSKQKSVHFEWTWEEAMDQLADERNALLDKLEKVLTTGWELGACIEAQTLVHTLRRQDSAREAEFSGKGNV